MTKGPRLLCGRLGILAAIRTSELTVFVDQPGIHQELAGTAGVLQSLDESVDLLLGQLP